MFVYAVKFFNDLDWREEIIGYFSTEEKAKECVEFCEKNREDYHIDEEDTFKVKKIKLDVF